MSRDLYFIKIGGHAMNVGDISTVSPARQDMRAPSTEHPAQGSKVTFMSKATSVYIHGLTPESFMDAITEAVNLALPD